LQSAPFRAAPAPFPPPTAHTPARPPTTNSQTSPYLCYACTHRPRSLLSRGLARFARDTGQTWDYGRAARDCCRTSRATPGSGRRTAFSPPAAACPSVGQHTPATYPRYHHASFTLQPAALLSLFNFIAYEPATTSVQTHLSGLQDSKMHTFLFGMTSQDHPTVPPTHCGQWDFLPSTWLGHLPFQDHGSGPIPPPPAPPHPLPHTPPPTYLPPAHAWRHAHYLPACRTTTHLLPSWAVHLGRRFVLLRAALQPEPGWEHLGRNNDTTAWTAEPVVLAWVYGRSGRPGPDIARRARASRALRALRTRRTPYRHHHAHAPST